MKNKGFTMIELLATIVILGVLMLVAVPSISNILSDNKKQTFLNDAKKFIALAEQADKKNNHRYDCFTLNHDTPSCFNIVTQDIENSPYQKKYANASRVIRCIKDGEYYYKVYLTDTVKSIEGAIKIKDKSAPSTFKNINEDKENRLDLIVDFKSSYELKCGLE